MTRLKTVNCSLPEIILKETCHLLQKIFYYLYESIIGFVGPDERCCVRCSSWKRHNFVIAQRRTQQRAL